MTSGPISVTELTRRIKDVLENDERLFSVSVTGEISNYRVYPSGHHYFTIKDPGSALRCVMFRSSAVSLRFRPTDGMHVICSGNISVYLKDGYYQLYVSQIVPMGIGELYLAYEKLKAKLSAEGLFDPEHKKALPRFPRKIALVTSPAGDVAHDMIRILRARWPMSEVLVVPARVQGEGAPAEIAGAIEYVNQYSLADLILTGRGGGSIEDLWAFNDEAVARAIYRSAIPVVSAVGHEPDVTIADYVADRRASTPSNAAEIAVPDRTEILDSLENLAIRLRKDTDRVLSDLANRLRRCRDSSVLRFPMDVIQRRGEDLDRLREKLYFQSTRSLEAKRSMLRELSARIGALDPELVLARGYSVAYGMEGEVLRNISQVKIGDRIRVRLYKGNLICSVDKTEEENYE